jgi:hypothetical protein
VELPGVPAPIEPGMPTPVEPGMPTPVEPGDPVDPVVLGKVLPIATQRVPVPPAPPVVPADMPVPLERLPDVPPVVPLPEIPPRPAPALEPVSGMLPGGQTATPGAVVPGCWSVVNPGVPTPPTPVPG